MLQEMSDEVFVIKFIVSSFKKALFFTTEFCFAFALNTAELTYPLNGNFSLSGNINTAL